MQKHQQKLAWIIAALIFTAALAACGGKSGAAQAVEAYYQAIIAQSPDQQAAVTCPDFVDTARVELDSFQGVKSELQGLSCKETGKEGENTLVKCDGKIVATYGSDKMDFPLGDRVHKVQEQNGKWLVCGY